MQVAIYLVDCSYRECDTEGDIMRWAKHLFNKTYSHSKSCIMTVECILENIIHLSIQYDWHDYIAMNYLDIIRYKWNQYDIH